MKVLIADDSVVHARNLARLLNELGHEVVGHARDGASAVKFYQECAPDLLLLDIVMPGMDGLSALRLICSRDKHARVIVLSSVGGIGGNVEEALKFGARGILTKPATREQIAHAIDEALCE